MSAVNFTDIINMRIIGYGGYTVMALVVRNLKIGTGMPKICVPITGQSIEEIKAEAVKIAADESKADLVE